MWEEILEGLASNRELEAAEVRFAMTSILKGEANSEQISKLLLGMKRIGERAQDVRQLLEVMYEHASLIDIPERAVDVVGTGGDGYNTINISTSAAIVTTAAGARVIKHGNRAASSASGAADLLEELGIKIDLDAAGVAECVRKIGIGFAFAPKFHPAMRHAGPVRKSLGVPTVFNILGPLANPARPKAVAIGVARSEMFELVAKVLAERGSEGFVFRGMEGLDEISISGPTEVIQVHQGVISRGIFDPSEIGIPHLPMSEIKGVSARENAAITMGVFEGEEGGPREAILLNAAVAIAAFKGDFRFPIITQFANGYTLAKLAIDSGKATSLVQRWRDLSNELAKSSL